MDSNLVVDAVATLVYNGTTYVLKAPMLNTTIPVDFILQNADIVAATPALNWPTSLVGGVLLLASIITTFALALSHVFLIPLWIGGWLMALAEATMTSEVGMVFSWTFFVMLSILPTTAGFLFAVFDPEEYRKINRGFDWLKSAPKYEYDDSEKV